MPYITRLFFIILLIFLLPAIFKIVGVLMLFGLGVAFLAHLRSSFSGGRRREDVGHRGYHADGGRRTRPDWWSDGGEGEVTLPESALKKEK